MGTRSKAYFLLVSKWNSCTDQFETSNSPDRHRAFDQGLVPWEWGIWQVRVSREWDIWIVYLGKLRNLNKTLLYWTTFVPHRAGSSDETNTLTVNIVSMKNFLTILPGGGTAIYELYRYVPLWRVWFSSGLNYVVLCEGIWPLPDGTGISVDFEFSNWSLHYRINVNAQ